MKNQYRVIYFDLMLGKNRSREFKGFAEAMQFIEFRIDNKTLYNQFRVEAV